MVRLRLPVDATPEGADDDASAAVISLVSPMGIEFSLVNAGPQTIEGRNPDQPAAIWLAILLEGAATLDDGECGDPDRALATSCSVRQAWRPD